MELLKGSLLAKEYEETLKKKVAAFKRAPCLAFILVGDNPASLSYVRTKKKACARVGIRSIDIELEMGVQIEKLLGIIKQLNEDTAVDGILIQLPLPLHLPLFQVLESVDPKKDVDGFHPINQGKLLSEDSSGFIPCTPKGILELLQHYQISTEAKHVVVVGRSQIVGKPLALLLAQKANGCNATVTLAHSKTHDLQEITKKADIVVAAIGKAKMVTSSMVKKGVVLIDVGINRDPSGSLVGDIDFEDCKKVASFISPVPGGVGPMTVASLLSNTVLSYERKFNKDSQ